MASIKDLKKRIATVKNTQQTTRAMKMVSAAKLRRAQEAITSQRPYSKEIARLIQELLSVPKITENFPWTRQVDPESGVKKKVFIVVVSSDRGLCGAFNSGVIKGA